MDLEELLARVFSQVLDFGDYEISQNHISPKLFWVALVFFEAILQNQSQKESKGS